MKIVLIGAGNLATHLGKALARAGHDVAQVYSRTMESAATLAAELHCRACCDLAKLDSDAEVYIISIKDSALASVAAQACAGRQGGVWLHTAGSMPLDVFKGLVPHYGVLYPMMTFSKEREVDFSVIPTMVEYNDSTAQDAVESLAHSVTQRVVQLSSARRRYLHLAAVWACNFANHCYDVASQLLAAHDIPIDVMLPLIDETARKVHTLTPRQAQTGPAVRYDHNVIAAQARLMAREAGPQLEELYLRLSQSIHAAAQQPPAHSQERKL